MEAYLAEQEELFHIIMKVTVSFKEQPKPITRGYIQTRMRTLDEYWNKFKTAHFELVKLAAGIQKQVYPYFRNDLFIIVDETYNKIRGTMADELEKISNVKTQIDWQTLALCAEETITLIKKIGADLNEILDSGITKTYLETRMCILDEYWHKLKTTHFEIMKSVTETEKQKHDYFTKDIFLKGKDQYVTIKAKLIEMVEKLSSPVAKIDVKAIDCCSAEVKETKIDITQLSGNNLWKSFRELCTTLMHDEPTKDKIQNVIEQGAQLLNSLQISEKNYQNTEDPSNKTLILNRTEVNKYLERLINQEAITPVEDYPYESPSIDKLLHTTEECLSSLGNVLDVSSWDPILLFILSNKLDRSALINWEKRVSRLPLNELPTLQTFMGFLKRRSCYLAEPEEDKYCSDCLVYGHIDCSY